MCLVAFSLAAQAFAQKQKVWVDADTGNETDDIYPLLRLPDEPSFGVIGVSSVHFNNADLVAFENGTSTIQRASTTSATI